MALVLNQEQSMLRDSARAFLAAQGPVAHLRALRDSHDARGYSPSLWAQCAEMGFAGVLVAESHGGLGLGLTDAAVIAAELGRTLTPTPFLSSAVLGARMLAGCANAALQDRWLPRIAGGQAVTALALDEHAQHRPQAIALQATPDGDGFRLTGQKCLVLDGHVADLLLVVARMAGAAASDDGLRVFAVDPGASGVSIERSPMVDAHNAARIRFDQVQVSADALLSPDTPTGLADTLDAGRVCVAAMLQGAGDEAFARTCAYLKERTQFGQRIGEFQALQHRAAQLYVELELSRAAIARATEAMDRNAPNAANLVAVAKAKACGSAGLAVQEAVQMHGGIGMTDALELGFFMKRVRVLQTLLGEAGFHESRLASLSGY